MAEDEGKDEEMNFDDFETIQYADNILLFRRRKRIYETFLQTFLRFQNYFDAIF